MEKLRVYELAKELGLKSTKLVNIMQDLGMKVSSHMNTVDEETAALIKEVIEEEKSGKKEKAQLAEEETETRPESKENRRPKKGMEREREQTENRPAKKKVSPRDAQKDRKEVILEAPLTVKEIAEKFGIPANRIIKELITMGIMANINQELDQEIIEKVADRFKREVIFVTEKEVRVDEEVFEHDDKPENLKSRPPVITVMGHVDHGKTSLLDTIRKTKVTQTEAGGITQHIGAYQVEVNGKTITFIDTPGHEAFTSLRARGARVTDIAILVVAADDGVMPQTVEAINHAKAAGIPIVVAINKIDKNNAQPDRVKQELIEYGLVAEEWGGDTICVEISALKNINIDELLEMVLLVAEMEELKANPDRPAEGYIIESKLDKGRGPVATLLVKNGTLRVGDPLIAGMAWGKVRAMVNDHGQRVEEAGPATPVEVLGFSEVPRAGDKFRVPEDEKEARAISEDRHEKQRERELQHRGRVSLDGLFSQIKEGEIKELNLIIKGDVQGSVEALRDSLLKLGTDEIRINCIHEGVGAINETDVMLASASRAIIIGFNVRPDSNARKLSEKEGIDIRTYRVIYKAIDDVKQAMEGMLEPELNEVVVGRAEVRDTFKVPRVGTVAGLYVLEGKINRNNFVRVLRDGRIIHEGEISSLKRFKDDVREVVEGYECGLGIENFNDIKVGDILEIYDYEEVKRTL